MNVRAQRATRGLSLIELMIALVLTALVIGAIAGVFLSAQATFRSADAVARLQENARAAATLIAADVREAGYADCAGNRHHAGLSTPPTLLAPFDDHGTRFAIPAEYFFSVHDCGEVSCTPALPAAWQLPNAAVAAGKRVPRSDVIVARRFIGEGAALLSPMSDPSAPLRIDAASAGWGALQIGTILVVVDCEGADWFAVSATGSAGVAHNAPLNRGDALGHAYGRHSRARVFRYDEDFVEHVYFLAYATTPEDDTALLPALRRRDRDQSEELLQGVDDLQVTLWLAAGDGQAQLRSPAGVAADNTWPRVRRAEIRLVVDSVSAPNTAPEPFVFDGALLPAASLAAGADRRLHREVVLPITLRNRAD